MKQKQQPTAKPIKYMAAIEVHRGGVSVQIAEVPSTQIAAVVAHALKCLEGAGVPDEPTGPIEQVGGYAPLDVREDDYEQGKGKPKRVGF